MTDLGTREMMCAVMLFCSESRTEQEVSARIRTLNRKMDDSMSSGLIAACLGRKWLAFTGPEAKTLKTTAKGEQARIQMEKEGFE